MNTQEKLELLKQNDIACITPDKDGAYFQLEFMQPVEGIKVSRDEMTTIWYEDGVQPDNQKMMKINLTLTRADYKRSLVTHP